MTRREVYRAGTVPLGTLRADVQFATGTAHTAAGCIGTKVWICKGELAATPPVIQRARSESSAPDVLLPN